MGTVDDGVDVDDPEARDSDAPVGPARAPLLLSDWPRSRSRAVLREARQTSRSRSLGAQWQARALLAGVGPALAALGAQLLERAGGPGRDALARECGVDEEGEPMLELALADPMLAQTRWEALLAGG